MLVHPLSENQNYYHAHLNIPDIHFFGWNVDLKPDDYQKAMKKAYESWITNKAKRISTTFEEILSSIAEQYAFESEEVKWLIDHGVLFELDGGYAKNGFVLIILSDSDKAMMFKLKFGGSI